MACVLNNPGVGPCSQAQQLCLPVFSLIFSAYKMGIFTPPFLLVLWMQFPLDSPTFPCGTDNQFSSSLFSFVSMQLKWELSPTPKLAVCSFKGMLLFDRVFVFTEGLRSEHNCIKSAQLTPVVFSNKKGTKLTAGVKMTRNSGAT